MRWSALLAILILATTILTVAGEFPPRAHMSIANPGTLAGTRAESVYRAIRQTMRRQYMELDDPVANAYQNWRRYNLFPYRSALHGQRFVNHYANSAGRAYGQFEEAGSLPAGSIVVKDSFVVTDSGAVMTGPLFLMEKREKGFNPSGGDWLFMQIEPDGTLFGMTGGRNAEKVRFCADCHNQAPPGQDHLYFMPDVYRVRSR